MANARTKGTARVVLGGKGYCRTCGIARDDGVDACPSCQTPYPRIAMGERTLHHSRHGQTDVRRRVGVKRAASWIVAAGLLIVLVVIAVEVAATI